MLLALALGDKMSLEQVSARVEIEGLNSELESKIVEVKEKEKARTLFFNNTSHELRTPLNGILGYLEIILRGGLGPVSKEVSEKIAKVILLAESLKNQVNTILDIARSEKGELSIHPEVIDLNLFVDDIERAPYLIG